MFPQFNTLQIPCNCTEQITSKIYLIHLQCVVVVPALVPHTAFLLCIRVTHKYKQLQKEEVLKKKKKGKPTSTIREICIKKYFVLEATRACNPHH